MSRQLSPLKRDTRFLAFFVKSIHKPSRTDLNQIRLKEIYDVDQLKNSILDNIHDNKDIRLPVSSSRSECNYMHVRGVYFFKYINSPWSLVESKRSGKRYYYNSESQISMYDLPDDDLLFSDPKYI